MKLLNLASLALIGVAATASCAQDNLQSDDDTSGNGSGATGGTAPATGGSAGAAVGSGGSTGGTGAGGTTPVQGGSAGTATSVGGASAAGGTGGSTGGGVSAGGMGAVAGTAVMSSGGAPATGGTAGQSAGGTAGMPAGGMDATGGTAGTGVAGSGMAGTGTAGTGGSGTLDIATLVPGLDGFYWEGTCSGNVNTSGKNCPIYDNGATSCPSGASYDTTGTVRNKSFKVMGTPGTVYTINFEVRGVAGTRCYTGGTGSLTGAPSSSSPNNTWYVGGKQSGDSWWNTYELHVENPPVTGEANAYYFNGFPNNPDYCQKETTYIIGYTAKFKVMGDSTLRFTLHDSNCQAQQNCGPDEASTTCTMPRTVDLTGMVPAATFAQPPTNTVGSTTYHPQWLYLDVKSVTSP